MVLGGDGLDEEDLMDLSVEAEISELDDSKVEQMVSKCMEAIKKVKVNVLNKLEDVFGEHKIILDNAAGISVFKDRDLFCNLAEGEPIRIDGVGRKSPGVFTAACGETTFGSAYYSTQVRANILSFAECVDNMVAVRYVHDGDYFAIHPTEESVWYRFDRDQQNNVYVCDMYNNAGKFVAVATVAENMAKYNKREVERARIARSYIRNHGAITEGELIKLLGAGKIRNTRISVQDVVRAHAIWGKDLMNIKGKTTANKGKPEVLEKDNIITRILQVDQTIYVDLLYFNGKVYLLTLFQPSEYIDVRLLRGRNQEELLFSIKKALKFMKNCGFKVIQMRCDGEAAIDSEWMKTELDMDIDISGGGDIKSAERKIRTIKERLRAFITTLPYKLTDRLEDWLMKYVIYYLNFTPTTTSMDNRSARERIRGTLIDANKDLKHGFGDYVQAGESSTDNTMTERARGAIALMPVGNTEGSWWYMALGTWRPFKRVRAQALPIPDEVIEYINNKANSDKKRFGDNLVVGLYRGNDVVDFSDEEDEGVNYYNDGIDLVGLQHDNFIPADNVNENVGQESDSDEDVEEQQPILGVFDDNEEPTADEIIELNDQGAGINEENGGGDLINQPEEQFADDFGQHANHRGDGEQAQGRRYNTRNRGLEQGFWKGAAVALKRIRRKVRNFDQIGGRNSKINSMRKAFLRRTFGMHMSVREGIKKLGYEAVLSIVKELIQLVDMKTFEGVDINSLSEEQLKLIITSSTFLKDKYTAQGVFDKLKARLVAGGHLQDRTIYDNGASPTANTSSVFMVAAIAATEGRAVATIDFPGAFLHSEMPDDDKPVLMRLNKFETKVLIAIDPSFKQYVLKNGTCVVKLKRALYGCVESARLWYEKLSGDLESVGFTKNKHDMCVFNRIEENGKQSTLVIHVDDVLVTACSEAVIDKIIDDICRMYRSLSVHRGRVLDYLGMTFDYSTIGKCKVTMKQYVSDLLEFCKDIEGTAKTPASDSLFQVEDNGEILSSAEKKLFHSVTAKILYLAKRVRPDLLTAISFLTKRVTAPYISDLRKLERLVRYIRGTQELGIVLEGSKQISVLGYVDASYGVHSDYKSHTGTIIGIGKGPIYAKSSGQKLNTKSSTEAELVGLSDSTAQIIWVRNFLIDQGYNMEPATIYQDNQSTIKLVKNGKSTSDRTRHIAIRFFFIADKVASKEIKVEYMATGDMIADILTKPLQGQLFLKLREKLLNWPSGDS